MGALADQLFLVSNIDVRRKIGALVFPDSANDPPSAHAGNPRCPGRLMRLHLRYVRGGLDLYSLSFVSEGSNLIDFACKRRGNLVSHRRVNLANGCQIWLITRDAVESLAVSRLSMVPRKETALAHGAV